MTTNDLKILVVDVGGSHVKLAGPEENQRDRFASGTTLSAKQMVKKVQALAAGWNYDRVSVGYPGPVLHDRVAAEPPNLGRGWIGFNFSAAFGRPVKLVNDAAIQALRGYRGGRMLFLGFGTGLGSALIVQGIIAPMELSHLPYKKHTYEDNVGDHGLQHRGIEKWRKHVVAVIQQLSAAFEPDEVLLGGGNIKHLDTLPPGCRRGSNADAFIGGIRLWDDWFSPPGVSSRSPG